MQTDSIKFAFSQFTWNAFDERISGEIWRTRAEATMLLRHTLCIDAAPIDAARKRAHTGDTFIRVGALVVRATANIGLVTNRHAATLMIGHRVGRTPAYDRAYRCRIQHGARLLRITNVRTDAWILAAFVHTCQFRCAVRIGRALRLLFNLSRTAHVRISKRSRLTIANGLMIASLARRLLGACVRIANGATNAIQSIACLMVLTVLVVLAMAANT